VKMTSSVPLVAAVVVMAKAATLAAPQVLRVARDLDGVSYQLTKPAPGDVHLLVFIGAECPISNRYAPEIARIASEYSPRHVRTFLIYADDGIDAMRARAHQGEFYAAVHLPVVIDPGGEWLAATGTTITPQAVIYTPAGRVYRGRIDDWYETISRNRRVPTVRDVRRSLDAVLAGRPVPVAETQAIGCYVAR